MGSTLLTRTGNGMYASINSWEGESNVMSQEPEVSCDDLSVTGVVVDLSLQHSINRE